MRYTKYAYSLANTSKINKILDDMMKNNIPQMNTVEYALIMNWDLITKNTIAQKAFPTRVKYRNNEGTLYLATTDSCLSVQIPYSQETILRKVNMFLGCNSITKINVINKHLVTHDTKKNVISSSSYKFTAKEKEKLMHAAASVGNLTLAESLTNLCNTITHNKKNI